jgi:hypothetical protein
VTLVRLYDKNYRSTNEFLQGRNSADGPSGTGGTTDMGDDTKCLRKLPETHEDC